VKPLRPQELRIPLAPAAMMTMNDNPLLFGQLGNSRRYLPHRNVQRPGDSGRGNFAILATVEQNELLAAIKHLFYGADIDIEGQRGHTDAIEGIMRGEKSKNQRTEEPKTLSGDVLFWFFGS